MFCSSALMPSNPELDEPLLRQERCHDRRDGQTHLALLVKTLVRSASSGAHSKHASDCQYPLAILWLSSGCRGNAFRDLTSSSPTQQSLLQAADQVQLGRCHTGFAKQLSNFSKPDLNCTVEVSHAAMRRRLSCSLACLLWQLTLHGCRPAHTTRWRRG